MDTGSVRSNWAPNRVPDADDLARMGDPACQRGLGVFLPHGMTVATKHSAHSARLPRWDVLAVSQPAIWDAAEARCWFTRSRHLSAPRAARPTPQARFGWPVGPTGFPALAGVGLPAWRRPITYLLTTP